jgi:myo-inositol 2-dehydrogenase / D-chiro-inositol 1-dehydrogenase
MRRLLVLIMGCTPILFSQTVSGVIAGVVKHQTEAVVVNAGLTLMSEATGAKRTAATNEVGLYSFNAVQPGSYIVENNVHGIDVLNWFLGGHPTKAHGTGGRTLIAYGDNQDHCYVTFDYANNVQALLNGTMIAPRFYRDVKERFFGESGVIETHREYWRHYRGPADVVTEKEARPDITIDALEEFVRRIQQKRPENAAVGAAESTLTAIMGRMAVDLRREVTWEEMMKSA